MEHYPTVSRTISYDIPIYAFDKLDGSNSSNVLLTDALIRNIFGISMFLKIRMNSLGDEKKTFCNSEYTCDDHVNRGCICNFELKKEYKQILDDSSPRISLIQNKITKEIREATNDDFEPLKDEQGRELPCCEYDYQEEGWEEEDAMYSKEMELEK